jgi:hypothetical protein
MKEIGIDTGKFQFENELVISNALLFNGAFLKLLFYENRRAHFTADDLSSIIWANRKI